MQFIYPPGATPLDPDEIAGLIPIHITTQTQLNEWEQKNILDAEDWTFSRKHKNILAGEFLQQLHQKMFGQTWRWAGKYRKTNKNIGIDWQNIAYQLKLLVDDVQYQIINKVYEFDEIAVRFHHRLVSIHPFPNGNGRHARLMTDILLTVYEQQKFTWGNINLYLKNAARDQYIYALRKADKHDYTHLIKFVRS